MPKKISLRKRGAYYHYNARLKDFATGKAVSYSGNTYCTDKRAAEQFAMERILPVLQARTVEECLALRMRVLSGLRTVEIEDAWRQYKRSSQVCVNSDYEAKWYAFIDWLDREHPKIEHMHEVSPAMAQRFIDSLDGRSVGTIKMYISLCDRVFKALASDAGIIASPFACACKPNGKPSTRSAFTMAHVRAILSQPESDQRYIFAVGMMTGLRLGDACMLRWSEIDTDHGVIVKSTAKTGTVVRIPIMDPLYKVLLTNIRDSEFVRPQLAAAYSASVSTVVDRNRSFLRACGIVTSEKIDGRRRAVARYGFHSCRHTFAYLAGIAGIPIVIVQSILGHMSPRMTELYQRHTQDEDAKRALMALSEVFSGERG